MKYVDLGLNIPATLHFTIMDKVVMVIGEVYISIRPAALPNITHVNMSD